MQQILDKEQILIAMGGNIPTELGSVLDTLRAAKQCLTSFGIEVAASSSWYETPPLGPGVQDNYVNAVIEVQCELNAQALLHRLHEVEEMFGRERKIKWGSRTLDLDLLDFRGEITPRQENLTDNYSVPLTLPHPQIAHRPFVLVPLQEVAPNWHHPVTGLKASEMLAALGPHAMKGLSLITRDALP